MTLHPLTATPTELLWQASRGRRPMGSIGQAWRRFRLRQRIG